MKSPCKHVLSKHFLDLFTSPIVSAQVGETPHQHAASDHHRAHLGVLRGQPNHWLGGPSRLSMGHHGVLHVPLPCLVHLRLHPAPGSPGTPNTTAQDSTAEGWASVTSNQNEFIHELNILPQL